MFWLLTCLTLICAWVCFQYYHLQKQLVQVASEEKRCVQRAGEHSITASSTNRPLLSLMEVTRAVTIVEELHRRAGTHELDERTGVDTRSFLDELVRQQHSVVRDIAQYWPGIRPEHPFNDIAVPLGEGASKPTLEKKRA